MLIKPSFQLTLALIIIGQALLAQSSDKYLKQLPQEDATLFFLTPQKWKSKAFKGKLETDLTYYLSEADSTFVQMGLLLKIRQQALSSLDGVELEVAGKTHFWSGNEIEQLFLDRKGKKWTARYVFRMEEEVFFEMLSSQKEPELKLIKSGSTYPFFPGGKWEKMCVVSLPILKFEKEKRKEK